MTPHPSLIRANDPASEVPAAPAGQPKPPDDVATTVPPVVVTFTNGIGQPACSMPSGGRWSLLTGYTPPTTWRPAYWFVSSKAISSPVAGSTSASQPPWSPRTSAFTTRTSRYA